MPATSPTAPAPSVLRIERIDDLPGLEAHGAAWDALGLASPAPEPLLTATHAWTACHIEHRLAEDERWACYLAYDGQALVGVLPVIRRRHPLLGGWRPNLRVPADFHTRDGDVAIAAGREVEVLRALLDAVDAHEGPYLELRLGGLRARSPAAAALGEAVRGSVFLVPDLDGRLLHVGDDWDAYRTSLQANFRRNLRKARNRCKTAGAEFRVLAGDEADPALFGRFVELEEAGWKGSEGTAIGSAASSRRFYEALVHRLAARGWLEWHVLELEGRWIAAHLAIRFGRELVLLRIAYDETQARLSPGNVLFAAVLERTFERRDATVVDCLTSQPWHDHWALEHCPYRLARIFPRRPIPFLLGTVPTSLRPLAKKVLGRG